MKFSDKSQNDFFSPCLKNQKTFSFKGEDIFSIVLFTFVLVLLLGKQKLYDNLAAPLQLHCLFIIIFIFIYI